MSFLTITAIEINRAIRRDCELECRWTRAYHMDDPHYALECLLEMEWDGLRN